MIGVGGVGFAVQVFGNMGLGFGVGVDVWRVEVWTVLQPIS